jgi:hypothetical protein
MFWDYLLTPVPQDEENCLNMNIFVPELRENEKASLFLWEFFLSEICLVFVILLQCLAIKQLCTAKFVRFL